MWNILSTVSLTFTKLFSSITESTIWCEDSDTRIVWVTLMAMADKRGRVWGSIPGIANRARVPVEIARKAIEKFLSPDPDSRSNTYDPSTEGRRIEVIEGGWRLINYEHYRAIRDEEERRAYKAEHERNRRKQLRDANRDKRGQSGHKWTPVDTGGHNAEAEAEADKNKNTLSLTFEELWKLWPRKDGGKGKTFQKFQVACKQSSPNLILERAKSQLEAWKMENRQPQYYPYLVTWINGRQFDTEPETAAPQRIKQVRDLSGNIIAERII